MTTLDIPRDRVETFLAAVAATGLPTPSVDGRPTLASVIVTFDPDLTTAEQAIVADALARATSSMSHLTRAQYVAVREQIQVLRDLRQLGRNAFMGLTAAERDRRLYDAQTATTIVLLALLRD